VCTLKLSPANHQSDGQDIRRVGAEPELIKGANGVFDVVADGELIFSKHQVSCFPRTTRFLSFFVSSERVTVIMKGITESLL
jgi:predicted Rdx family selenoprotein